MTFKPDIVYYHYPCSDGLTSAAVVYSYYGPGAGIEFIPLDYGNPRNVQEHIDECRDKTILMVDVSFKSNKKVNDLEKVAQSANQIVIIDHHAGVYEDLQQYDAGTYIAIENFEKMVGDQKIALIFDNSHSGAGLAWSIFNQDKSVPEFIKYIEHIDLGRSSLPNAAQFRSWSRSLPFSIPEIAKAIKIYQTFDDLEVAFEGGKAIEQFVRTRIDVIKEQVRYLKFDGYKDIPYVISDYAFASEAANVFLSDDHPMALVFFFTKTGLGASLRSTDEVDVSEFAKKFGGNGHKRAAGFNIPWTDLPAFIESFEAFGNPIFGNMFLEQ